MLSAVRGSNWRQLQVNFLLLFLSVTVSGINVSAGLRAVLWVKSVCGYRVTPILHVSLQWVLRGEKKSGIRQRCQCLTCLFFLSLIRTISFEFEFYFDLLWWIQSPILVSRSREVWRRRNLEGKEEEEEEEEDSQKKEREEIKQSPIVDRRRRRGGEKRECPKPDAKLRFFLCHHRGRSAQVGVSTHKPKKGGGGNGGHLKSSWGNRRLAGII